MCGQICLLRIRGSSPVVLDPFGGVDFGRPPNFTYDDDTFCVWIMFENLQSIHKRRPRQDIPSHTDA